MPKEIPESVTRRIIKLWFMGFTPEQIANKTGVSYGTVRNKIADLNAGKFEEYTEYREQLDDMRWVARQTRGKGRGLQEALLGLSILEGLQELGIEPAELTEALGLFRRLKQADALPEKFFESAKRLMDAEKTTGLRYEKMVEEYQKITDKIESLRSEETKQNRELARLRQIEKQELEKLGLTRQELASYRKDREALESVHLTIEDLSSTAEFIRGTSDRSLPDSAAEFAKLKAATGSSYKQLTDEYREKSSNLERLESKARELEQRRQTLTKECATAEAQLKCELEQGKVTREQLMRYAETRRQLASNGLDIAEIHNLPVVVENLKQAGYDYKQIIAYLGQINNLRNQTKDAEDAVKSLQLKISNEKLELAGIRGQTTAATKVHQELVESVQTERSNLKDLAEKRATLEATVQFAETFTKLMLDPSKLNDRQIEMLISKLDKIRAVRADRMGLPVDYEGLRQETQTLVEIVLGKQLILRETYLNETKNLRDKNHELLLDRLGRLGDIHHERRDLEVERETFKALTRQQLTRAAVAEVSRGNITTVQCNQCSAVLAYHADRRYLGSFCPVCSSGHWETVTLENH